MELKPVFSVNPSIDQTTYYWFEYGFSSEEVDKINSFFAVYEKENQKTCYQFSFDLLCFLIKDVFIIFHNHQQHLFLRNDSGNTIKAVAIDIPMHATYGKEISNLKVKNILFEFLFLIVGSKLVK